jgi:hypothetical protein
MEKLLFQEFGTPNGETPFSFPLLISNLYRREPKGLELRILKVYFPLHSREFTP